MNFFEWKISAAADGGVTAEDTVGGAEEFFLFFSFFLFSYYCN